MDTINTKFIQAQNDRNELSKKVRLAEENSEDPLVKTDRERKQKLEDEYNNIQQNIGRLKKEKEENTEKIGNNKKEIEAITNKLKVSEDKLSISQEVQKTIKVLKSFIIDFKAQKSQSLSKRIKENLDILLHKKSFIDAVKIDIIGEIIEIKLLDLKGCLISTDTLSKGEQQMYATALLKGLVDESNIEFPVFIDSPMQKFDIDHSNSIVKHFYPKVSNQVIIFPLLKKEMSKDEFDVLMPNISKTYLIKNSNNENSNFYLVEDKEKLFNVFEKNYQDAI